MSLVDSTRQTGHFALNPSLADVLLSVDKFGAALLAPPVAEVQPPYVFIRQYPEPPRITAVDHRKQLTEQLVTWHNQLVQARLQLDTASDQVKTQMLRVTAAEKRVTEIGRELATVQEQLEEKTQELSRALHTISELQERELDRLSLTQDPMTAASPAVAS